MTKLNRPLSRKDYKEMKEVDILDKLYHTIAERKRELREAKHHPSNTTKSLVKKSYVASLLEANTTKLNRKVMEEAYEVTEATRENKQRLIEESSDLLFHLLTLLVKKNISLKDVKEELRKRMGIGGFAEKRNRKK